MVTELETLHTKLSWSMGIKGEHVILVEKCYRFCHICGFRPILKRIYHIHT